MFKDLSLTSRQNLEAVPFFDAHASLSYPLRIRYIVEAHETQQRMKRDLLNETLRVLFAFHDLLRTHMFEDQSILKLFITPLIPEEPVQWVDLANSSATEQHNAIRETMNAAYDSLLHGHGFLCRFLYFDLGERTNGLFVTVIHHVLADAYSMRILSQDIQRVYLQLCARKPARLPLKTASFNAFAARLQKYLHQEFPGELDYWRPLQSATKPFAVDYTENWLMNPHTNGTLVRTSKPQNISFSLSEDETDALLRALPAARLRVEDVLLAGVIRAAIRKLGKTGIYINALHHGRTLFEDIDVSHTIGYIAQNSWQYFQLDPALSPAECLQSITEQRKRIPRRGIGLSLAANCSEHQDPAWSRFCSDEDLDVLRAIYYSDNLLCNYLGKEIRDPGKSGLFTPADRQYQEMVLIPAAYEVEIAQETQKPCMLQALTLIRDNKLILIWEYEGTLYRTETIEAMAHIQRDAIKSIIAGFLVKSPA
jgi:hypothetical protein